MTGNGCPPAGRPGGRPRARAPAPHGSPWNGYLSQVDTVCSAEIRTPKCSRPQNMPRFKQNRCRPMRSRSPASGSLLMEVPADSRGTRLRTPDARVVGQLGQLGGKFATRFPANCPLPPFRQIARPDLGANLHQGPWWAGLANLGANLRQGPGGPAADARRPRFRFTWPSGPRPSPSRIGSRSPFFLMSAARS